MEKKPKKSTEPKPKKVSKYHEKIVIDGSFAEAFRAVLNTPPLKKKPKK
jgi:hypothetical protein